MASAKQIAWRKKFARMSKAGKFKKSKTKTTSKYQEGETKFLDAKGNWRSKYSKGKVRIEKIYSNWLKNKGTLHDGSRINWIHLAGLEGFSTTTAGKFWSQKNGTKKSA